MALTYNRQVRTLGIRGVITLTSGAQVNLTAEDVLYYSISESCGEDGLPLGTAEAASFELTISNVGKGYTPDQFDNAEVHMQIGIETDGAIAYSDFGVWYVCEVNAPEQSVSIDLSGYDALATLFEVDYADSEGAYPTSLGSLTSTICAAAGISLKSRNFVNADILVSKMPEWGANATLRTIIGFISACAGGFAHIDRSGLLEIVSYNSGSEYEINTDLYSALTRTNGTSFSFNALQVKFVDSEDDAYTRYALQTSTEGNPTNTIRIENNPLFTEGIANSVVTVLTGVSANPASVNWVGDPSVKLGDVLIATNMAGDRVRLIVNSQSFSFSGGFNAESACTLPALNTINGSSYTSSGNIMDGNGNIKATRITNLDKTIVSATIGHFENLDAESIKTDALLASIIDAVILRAQNISSSSVETDKLTSAIAEIVNATIRKLNAGTITTDELYASYAELFALKTDSITADNILTDALAAELARITVLACGSATFDKATIQHLVAEAMNLEYGVAGQVFIKNLAVEYAQMVGATIGNLCIKASDGNYYSIDVDADGNVSATKTTVSDSDISAGQFISQKDIFSSENAQTGYVNSSGVFSPTSGYTTYGYFEIGEGVVYTVNSELPSDTWGYIRVAYYDADKNFLLREMSESKAKSYSSTTPSGCAYVRISMEVAYTDIQLLVPAETRVILETNITAANLNTSNLLATYALINKIDAARIDVAELFAQSAFVDALYTSKIYGDKSIEMIVGQLDTAMSTTDVEFCLSDSATELTGDDWQTVAPPWEDGKYMWMRVKTTLKNGTTHTSDPTCISGATGPQGPRGLQGLQGETGEQGIQGPQGEPGADGADGMTSYFHIKYSDVENPTSSAQLKETPSTYIGTYVDYVQTDSTDPSKYTWARFQGLQGETGEQGIPGTNGANGKTSYLHIKYSDDGGLSFTGNNGEDVGDYIGQYVDFTLADSSSVSDYKWSKIKGDAGANGADGVSVTAMTEQYYLSDSNTTQTGGQWQTTQPAWTQGKYIWTRVQIDYSDGSVSYTEPYYDIALETAGNAQSAADAAQGTADNALPRVEFQRVVRIDNEGLHVGDNQSNGEVLVDSNSVNVVFNGQKYSKFSGNYVQFGNYQLRRSSDGGLVFKLE